MGRVRLPASLLAVRFASERGKCDTSPEPKAVEFFGRRYRPARPRHPRTVPPGMRTSVPFRAISDLLILYGTVSQTYQISRLFILSGRKSQFKGHVEAGHPRRLGIELNAREIMNGKRALLDELEYPVKSKLAGGISRVCARD
jgi:hypothetical protein